MQKRPHICLVSHFLDRKQGAHSTTQAELLASHLRRDGYEVTCVSSKNTRLGRLSNILFTILNHRNRIDLVLIEVYSGLGFVVADLASWIANILEIPSVLVLHGGNLPEHTARHLRWTMRVLDRARIIVAPSRFLATAMCEKGISVRVIPNVLNEFPDMPARQRSPQPKLLWMRSFHKIYDPLTAVKVFSIIKKVFHGATLVMAGSDKGLEKATKNHVADLGLSDAVAFPGFLDSAGKAREFSSADVYINTNIVDNSPVSLIEAWSYGIPIVTTDVGGIPYMIDDGVNGLLAARGDAEGMAAKIVSLIESPDLARLLSRNGREVARKSTWDVVRPQWERVFEEAQSAPKAARIRQPA